MLSYLIYWLLDLGTSTRFGYKRSTSTAKKEKIKDTIMVNKTHKNRKFKLLCMQMNLSKSPCHISLDVPLLQKAVTL